MKEQFKFSSYQSVEVRMGENNVNGFGRIVGCTGSLPIIGTTYLVMLDDPAKAGVDANIYPFPCVAIPENCLSPVPPEIGLQRDCIVE